MEHTIRHERGRRIIAFAGEVDLETSPDARAVLLEAVELGHHVIVDMGGVTYIDSSGVASLVEALQAARGQETQFRVAGVNPAALRVFKMARLDEVFELYDTVEAGLDHGS